MMFTSLDQVITFNMELHIALYPQAPTLCISFSQDVLERSHDHATPSHELKHLLRDCI